MCHIQRLAVPWMNHMLRRAYIKLVQIWKFHVFSTPLFLNSPGMTFGKWGDDRVCILVDSDTCVAGRGNTYWCNVERCAVARWLSRENFSAWFSANNANKMDVVTVNVDGDEGILTSPIELRVQLIVAFFHMMSSVMGSGEPLDYEVNSPNIFLSILFWMAFSPTRCYELTPQYRHSGGTYCSHL
jgi:hypothetical protein